MSQIKHQRKSAHKISGISGETKPFPQITQMKNTQMAQIKHQRKSARKISDISGKQNLSRR